MVVTDITKSSGAQIAVAGSALAAVVDNEFASDDKGVYPRVYYFTASGHVMELAWGGGWNATDVTSSGGGVLAAYGSALTAMTVGTASSSPRPRVYYFDVQGHVQELAWVFGWHSGDITNQTGALNAAQGSGLTCYAITIKNDSSRIYYTGTDGHVRQLSWMSGWSTTDLSGTTGSVIAAPGGVLASAITGTGQESVYYVSADSHVHQFLWANGWHSVDVNTGVASTPPTSSGGGGGGGGGTHQAN